MRPPQRRPRTARAPAVLVIAGSDPGGGAGLQGDLATLAALGCYGMAVPTALTVQAPSGVRTVAPVAASLIAQTLTELLRSLAVDAIKIGMLHDAATVRAVTRALRGFEGPVVLDPVLRPTRGRSLSTRNLAGALLDELWPRLRLATPNLDETAALCGHAIDDVETMIAAASALRQLGAGAVLVKGGHLRHREAIDVLADEGGLVLLSAPRRRSARTHGTGCALSTCIAANLARGLEVRAAAIDARTRLDRALGVDHPVGRGTGSVAHAALAGGKRPTPR